MEHISPLTPRHSPFTLRPWLATPPLAVLLVAVTASWGCGDDTSPSSTPSVSTNRPDDPDDADDDDGDDDDDDGDAATNDPSNDPSDGDEAGPEGSTSSPDDPDESGGPDVSNGFDDEFDGDHDHLMAGGPWQRLFPEQAGSMIEGERPGFLSFTASADSVDNSWYFDDHGAALVKEVTGNFAIVTSLAATSTQGGGSEPSGLLNSGGLLIRDVASVEGDENWLNFNIGRQASAYGREIKKTVTSGSNSFQNAQTDNTEHLLVCRLGTQFRFYHWDQELRSWEAERFDNEFETPAGVSTTEINDLYDASRNPELDLPPPGESIEIILEFPTISATVQVGVMINSWGTPHDVTSAFDYIRMSSIIPESPSDCTAELTAD